MADRMPYVESGRRSRCARNATVSATPYRYAGLQQQARNILWGGNPSWTFFSGCELDKRVVPEHSSLGIEAQTGVIDMLFIVSFDLHDANPENYNSAYQILAAVGLYPITPNKQIGLPDSTVMGNLSDNITSEYLRDRLKEAFAQAGLRVKSIFGGALRDWAAWGTVSTD